MPIRTDSVTGSGNANPFDQINSGKPSVSTTNTRSGPAYNSGSGGSTTDSLGGITRGKVAGFSAGFSIADGLKERVRALESKLAGELQVVSDTKNGAADSESKKGGAWSKLNVWDKHFRWIPVAHDKEKIKEFKDAKAADGAADSALQAAQAQADATDRAIRNEIAAFLRGASGTNFGELEQGHREASAALQSTQSFKRAVRDAISAVESAISAKQWDNMSDAMNHNRPHHGGGGRGPGHMGGHHGGHGMPGPFGNNNNGFDFQDMHAMSARSDAQAAIGRAQGAAEGFRAMLSSYRGQVVGGTGSLAGISVGGGFFDFFLSDNVWMGMAQINDMHQARGQLESVAAQIGSVEAQIGGHVNSFKSAMDSQINAVRSAIR